MQEAEALKTAFLEKEKNQNLLANLGRLRSDIGINDEQYAAMKYDYQTKITAAEMPGRIRS